MSRRLPTAIALVLVTTVAAATGEARADDAKPAAPAAAKPADAKPADAKPAEAKSDAKADDKKDGDADATDSVFLHVVTPDPVTIERDDTGETVCASPCDKNVPANGRYRIGGARPSPVFGLAPSKEGKANVKVAPGSRGEFWVGVGIMGVGAGLLGGGIATLLYWNANRPAVPGGDGVNTDNRYTYAMMAGTGLCILGTVAEIWGTASVINNIRTRVKGNVQQAKAPRIDLPSRPSMAEALPRSNDVPLVGGTF